MAYYCPFCGGQAYRGHRDYKCGNEECENHQQPVFTLEGKPLNSEGVQNNLDLLSRYGVNMDIRVRS